MGTRSILARLWVPIWIEFLIRLAWLRTRNITVSSSRRFPLELHLVHRNLKYASVGESLKHPDGLAVIGIFFELNPYPTSATWMQGFKKHHVLDNVRRMKLIDALLDVKQAELVLMLRLGF